MKDLRNLLNKRKIYVKDLLYQKSKKKFKRNLKQIKFFFNNIKVK